MDGSDVPKTKDTKENTCPEIKKRNWIRKHIIFSLSLAIIGFLLLIIGFLVGNFANSLSYKSFLSSLTIKRQNNPAYTFTHPIIDINSADSNMVGEFNPLTQKIQAVLDSYKNRNVLNRYSVYFRDQNNGFWVGINQDSAFNPASMLKVAMAMAVYKQAETVPGFLDKYFVYTPKLASINANLTFAQPTVLKVNTQYKASYLLRKMVSDSDNGAKDILASIVDQSVDKDLFFTLGVPVPTDGSYVISTKEYTTFFESLYNATYLSQDYSNTLLDLLSKTNFDDGLVAGVPGNIVVSHKYGEYVNSNDGSQSSIELHDCGIIYEPNEPYALCVMTEGADENRLADVITKVSKTVYLEVSGGYN